MKTVLISIISLFTGMALLLLGHGLTGTLITLRAAAEGYSDSHIGLIMSAYFVGYIIGSRYCPALINRVGHIRVFAASAACCAALIILHGLWVQPWLWLLERLVYGICIVAFYMVLESWLNARADNAWRGRLFAVYMLVNLIAMAGGQQLLMLAGIEQLELFAIAAVLFSLSLIPIALTRVPEPQPVPLVKTDIRSLFTTSPVALAGCIASGLAGSAFWTMGPLFAQQTGFNTGQIAWYMSITIIGGAVLQLPVGHYSDRFDRRKVLAMVSFLSALTAFLSIATQLWSFAVFLLVMFIYGGLYFAVYPLSVSHANDRARPEELITLSSTLLFSYGIAATAGPFIAGILMQYLGPYSLPIFYSIVWAALGIFIVYRLKQTDQVPVSEMGSFAPLSRTSAVALQAQSTAAQTEKQ